MLTKLLQAAKGYTLWDWMAIKLALISIGILLGIYLYPLLYCYTSMIWIVGVVCYLTVACRTWQFFKKL